MWKISYLSVNTAKSISLANTKPCKNQRSFVLVFFQSFVLFCITYKRKVEKTYKMKNPAEMCDILPVDKRKNRRRIKESIVFNLLRVVQDDKVCQSAHRAESALAATVTTAGWEEKDVTPNIPGTEAELDLRRQRPSPQLGGRRRMSRETYQVRRQSWTCAGSDRHHSWVGGEGCHVKHTRYGGRAGPAPAATVTTAGWEAKDVTRNIPE